MIEPMSEKVQIILDALGMAGITAVFLWAINQPWGGWISKIAWLGLIGWIVFTMLVRRRTSAPIENPSGMYCQTMAVI
jgi:hypothetical protein